jgi:hypothetical protein
MNQNPQQRMQDQMRQQRERQMKAAAYAHMQAEGGQPRAQSAGGCAGMIRVGLTFVLSLIGFGVLCGGGGYVIGDFLLDHETALIGGAAGGLLAFVLAALVAIRAASR